MKFLDIKDLDKGTNESLTLKDDVNEKFFVVVDDLKMKSIDFKDSNIDILFQNNLSSSENVVLTFGNVQTVSFIEIDTYEAYNTHSPEKNFTEIDQIMYDPDKTSEETQITIVGYGWVLRFDAESLTANYIV